MFPYIIFSITIFILLYFLYKNMNTNLDNFFNYKNLESFSNFNFTDDKSLNFFNTMFEKQMEIKKNTISEEYIDIDTKFYRKPLKLNSNLLNEYIDDGVLKNFRPFEYNNTYSQEINYNNMNKILNEIKKMGEYNLNIKYDNLNEKNKKEIYNKIIQFLIKNINYHFKKLNLEIDYHKFDKRKFKYLSYNLIKDEEIKDKTIDNRKFNINFYIIS